MAIESKIFPTRWPLIDFSFEVYKFHIYVGVMRPSIEALSYEYLMVYMSWGTKTILNFRLYDTERRLLARIDSLRTMEITKKNIKEAIAYLEGELKKI